MLIYSDSIQKNINLKNRNKSTFVKLYYSDTEFLTFSHNVVNLDGILTWPSIIKYSPTKSTWNWNGNNNVTNSVPTISITNIETPDGFSLWDQFHDLPFYGKRCQILFGFDGDDSLTSSELIGVFDGEIDDITFSTKSNSISIVMRSNQIQESFINGEKFDYATSAVTYNDVQVATLTGNTFDLSDAIYAPVLFGYSFNHPAILLKEDHYVRSSTAYSNIYDQPFDSLGSQNKFFAGNNYSEFLYALDDEAYVPIPKEDANYHTNGENYWTTSTEDDYRVFKFNDSATSTWRKNSLIVNLPYRVDDFEYETDGNVGITGNIANMFNADGSDGFKMNASGDFNAHLYITAYNSFYKNYRGFQNVIWRKRPVDIPSSNAGTQWCLAYETNNFFGFPDFKPIINLVHDNNWDRDPATNNGSYISSGLLWNFSTTAFAAISADENSIMVGSYGDNFSYVNPTGFDFQFTGLYGTWFKYSNGDDVIGVLDTELKERETIKKYMQVLDFEFVTQNPIIYIDLYDFCSVIFSSYEKPIELYQETTGMTVNGPDFYSITSAASDYNLRRPYEYIETILRHLELEGQIDEASFSGMTEYWLDYFERRRDFSGFAINEEVKLNDFLKDYLMWEPFSVYVNEENKYKIVKFPIEDPVSQKTINFNDLNENFNIGFSKKQKLYSKIANLKQGYKNGSDDYENNIEWGIKDPEFDPQFYGSDNVLEEVEKRYTSNYRPMGFESGGNSYFIVEDGSDSTSVAASNVEFENPLSATDLIQRGSESYEIARFILNQFANRRAVINLTTSELDYYSLEIGDVVDFENVPYNLGNLIGFKDGTETETTKNGQILYNKFIITGVTKGIDIISLECTQLAKLNNFIPKFLGDVAM